MSITGGADRFYNEYNSQPRGFLTPPPTWNKTRRYSPAMPATEKKARKPNQAKGDLFHVIHKVPSGDSPYVRAKHVQLIDKDPGRAISLFWSAINAGDRVDSALKDMAVVMKQLDRSDEAIEAIKSFRHRCPPESQESLDNILVELYKQSGRIKEEVEMLQVKLKQVEEGIAFGGRRTKIARSQGKKVQITVEKEYSRLLGNLAWAYMQQKDYKSAEEHYRKALSFESDKNKQCNLAICLMHMNKFTEAKFLMQAINVSSENGHPDESYAKSYERASQMLTEMESQHVLIPMKQAEPNNECGVERGFVGQRDNGFYHQKYCNDKNSMLPSPLPCSMKKTNNGAFTEYLYEKKVDLNWKMNHCQFNSQELYPACKKPYEAPFCNRVLPKAPLTQPQCSRYGDQRDGTSYGSSCRKLSFESSEDNASVQSLVSQNVNYCSSAPTEPLRMLPPIPSMTGDYWRKNSSDSLDKMRASEERMHSLTFGCQKPAAAERGLLPNAVYYDDSAETQEIYKGDSGHCCDLISAKLSQQTCGIPTCEQKKSWADMVEEDEQGVENWRDEFNDENVDFNVIAETPKAIDQVEKLSQKIELIDLGGGYYTQPEKTTPARRSLCFNQRCSPNVLKNHYPEQLATKVLNFEDQALVLSEDLSSTKSMKRRNRLQVFQDITRMHESPAS